MAADVKTYPLTKLTVEETDGSPSVTDVVTLQVDSATMVLTQVSAGVAKIESLAGAAGAPTNAEYLVGAAHASLSAERVVTDTATVTWDLTVAGQAKANAVGTAAHATSHQNGGSDEISVAGLSGQLADAQLTTVRKNTGADVGTRARLNFIEGTNVTLTVTDDAGGGEVDITVASTTFETAGAVAAHAAAADPHTGYQKESEKDAASGYAGLSAGSKLTGSQQTYGSGVNTACEGNDSRLSDARAPTAHTTSHQSGGSDPIKLDDLAAPDDNADLNASTTAHGLLKKLSNVSTEFMNGVGNYAVPAGTARTRTVNITIGNGTDVVSTGAVKSFPEIGFAGTITGWTLIGDGATGSAVVDILKSTYANAPLTVAHAITAAAKPTISAATKNQSSTLTGWTTAVTALDIFGYIVDSCSTFTRLTLSLKILES